MKVRFSPTVLFAGIGLMLLFGENPCQGMIKEYRARHEQIMQRAREQINIEPVPTGEIRVLDPNVAPVIVPPAARIEVLQEQINSLPAQIRTDPNEITALRKELDEVAEQSDSEMDPSKYNDLSEKLEIAHAYARAIDEKRQTYNTNLDELKEIYDTTASTGESAESWLTKSFIANIVVILGLVTRVGNISSSKLDRQLKLLQIAEKKAQLEKDGIKLE